MMLPLMTLTLNTVDENEVASAAGLQSFMRTIATAVATSITLSYWGDTQRLARSDAVAVLQPEAAQASLAGLGFPPDQVRQVLSNMVDLEATTMRSSIPSGDHRHPYLCRVSHLACPAAREDGRDADGALTRRHS